MQGGMHMCEILATNTRTLVVNMNKSTLFCIYWQKQPSNLENVLLVSKQTTI